MKMHVQLMTETQKQIWAQMFQSRSLKLASTSSTCQIYVDDLPKIENKQMSGAYLFYVFDLL